uniref:Transcriptional regulator n=1 Tax=Panagrellus redivivus TaxID=6233 RepID=A0A7E4ZVL8_PANRE
MPPSTPPRKKAPPKKEPADLSRLYDIAATVNVAEFHESPAYARIKELLKRASEDAARLNAEADRLVDKLEAKNLPPIKKKKLN